MNPDLLGPAFAHPIARAIGWSLLHFIWQGALIGVSASVAFALLRRASSQARYAVAARRSS